MNKKFFAVRFLFCVFAILLSSSVAAHMVEHKGVLKEYQWPTRITIDHFVTFVEAAPMWLNIFQVPDGDAVSTLFHLEKNLSSRDIAPQIPENT